MLSLINKLIKKYSEIILKLFTFTGLLIIYTFGISVGYLIFKNFKKNNLDNRWYRFDNKFNPKDMF